MLQKPSQEPLQQPWQIPTLILYMQSIVGTLVWAIAWIIAGKLVTAIFVVCPASRKSGGGFGYNLLMVSTASILTFWPMLIQQWSKSSSSPLIPEEEHRAQQGCNTQQWIIHTIHIFSLKKVMNCVLKWAMQKQWCNVKKKKNLSFFSVISLSRNY